MKEFSSKYLFLLQTKLSGLNLTKILGPEEFYQKQILDSINPYLQSSLFQEMISKTELVVDIGFGGGFPILPLAKLLPNVRFVGIESKKKKVEAVKSLATDLNLNNVTLIHSQLEDVLFDVPAVITFKAVGTVRDYLAKIKYSSKDLSVFFYKGPSFNDLEGAGIDKDLAPNWSFKKVENIEVPGTQKRLLVSFFAQNVPRGTSKFLVKISDLFKNV